MLLALMINMGMAGGGTPTATGLDPTRPGGKKRRGYERLRGKVTPDEFRLAREIIERVDREEPETQSETRQIIQSVVEKELKKQVRRSKRAIFPAVAPMVSRLEELILPILDEPRYEDLVGISENLKLRQREEEWLILFLATMK